MKLGLLLAAAGVAASCLSTSGQAADVIIRQDSVTITNGTGSASTVVDGNGKIVTEDRAISPVTEVRIGGAFEVEISVGNAASLTLEGDENVLPLIKTVISGREGTLRIYPDGSYSSRNPVKVRLSLPQLLALSVSGSSTIDASGFDQHHFTIDMSGAAHVGLAGKVSTFAGSISGSGNLSAKALRADTVTIDISGAGNCTATAHQRVVANISGAGSIAVHGNPPLRSTHVSGAGHISFAN